MWFCRRHRCFPAMALVAPVIAGAAVAIGMVSADPVRAGTLRGRVISAGQPVHGAFVSVVGAHGRSATVSGANGAFSFTLPDGNYRLGSDEVGFRTTVMDANVAGTSVHDIAVSPSGTILREAPIFGGGNNVVADGTPGVFYLSGDNPGGVYRTTDWGGTWTQVSLPRDNPQGGLAASGGHLVIATSGFPGEVAVSSFADARVFYSTDYGVTWSVVGNSQTANRLAWGHAGSRSVLVETGTDRTYVADMSAPTPAFVQMTRPYALPPQEIAAANGVDQPWLATVTKSGTVLVYPLVASATAPVPTVVMPKFTTEPLEVAIGGRSAPGKPPAVVVAGGIYHVSMSVKAPGASSYPSPHEAGLGSKCFRPANSPSGAPPSVAPNSSGSYAAAWIDGCWVQFAGGALTTQGDYGAGAVGAIDAGYNATDTSPGSDAVVLLGPRPATMFATAGVGVMKLAGSAGGFPVALTDPTVVAMAGHASASGGLATDGVTASSVHQTTFGPTGGGMLASATDVGGAVSTDGGVVRARHLRSRDLGGLVARRKRRLAAVRARSVWF